MRSRYWTLLFSAIFIATSCGDTDERSTEAVTFTGSGEELYAQACASCHGADLRGTNVGPSQLSIVYEPNHHSDDAYRSAIANGAPQHHWPFGDMEPVVGLNAAQVEAIITYVRSVQEREGFEQ